MRAIDLSRLIRVKGTEGRKDMEVLIVGPDGQTYEVVRANPIQLEEEFLVLELKPKERRGV